MVILKNITSDNFPTLIHVFNHYFRIQLTMILWFGRVKGTLHPKINNTYFSSDFLGELLIFGEVDSRDSQM